MSQLSTVFDRLLSVRTSEKDRTSFVRESYFKRDTPLADLLSDLRAEQFTGQVVLDVTQGTVQGIRVRDEVKSPPVTISLDNPPPCIIYSQRTDTGFTRPALSRA